MSETAAHIALIETASWEGILARRHHIKKHGPQEMGWSYANILEVENRLSRQLHSRGFFRVYLHTTRERGGVRHRMNVVDLETYAKPAPFRDPVDGRRYLVHSKMRVSSIEELDRVWDLSEFSSVDRRKPDLRHLQLGFLFVVDPEV